MFTPQDIEKAMTCCNFQKGIGPDGFDGKALSQCEPL
jgi:hypothetical protein